VTVSLKSLLFIRQTDQRFHWSTDVNNA